MKYSLRMTGGQHAMLTSHLFPGDGMEAVALLICGRRNGRDRHIFTVNKVVLIPHEACERSANHVTWPTHFIDQNLLSCQRDKSAIVKIHSHPTDYPRFSSQDDESDRETYSAVSSLLEDGLPHASLVMLPSGNVFGRVIQDGMPASQISLVQVSGDNIQLWPSATSPEVAAFAERHAQAFGRGTANLLRHLSIAIVGCSGTGSIVIELLARLGVGRLVIIDPDHVEDRNLNRILNAGKEDVYLRRSKVEVLARAIARIGIDQQIVPICKNLVDADTVRAVAECDAVFGCMDGVEGRHWLNRIATFYNLPYIDVGVRLDADGKGGIDAIAGAVNYLQPGLSSLLSRGVYSMPQVEAEEIRRTNPQEYEERQRQGYLRGIVEDRPAVISVNTFFASMAVNEFLARIHAYRNEQNSEYAYVGANLSELQFYREPEVGACPTLNKHVGRGDVNPLLDRASLS